MTLLRRLVDFLVGRPPPVTDEEAERRLRRLTAELAVYRRRK